MLTTIGTNAGVTGAEAERYTVLTAQSLPLKQIMTEQSQTSASSRFLELYHLGLSVFRLEVA